MKQFQVCLKVYVILIILIVFITACINNTQISKDETSSPTPTESSSPQTKSPSPSESPPSTTDKMALWNMNTGPHLRGANIYQRRVYPELDGPEYMGPGPVGPPYTQKDFDRLAAMGANYVNISHPGLFTETPPYTLDKDLQNNLDNLLRMIAKADMFAVISFRTGPGRSEFTFMLEDVGDWFDEKYLNDSIWHDKEAQNAWVAMWRYTAERYRDNPVVVGYDLMVEPNSNEVGRDALNNYLGIWEPDEFYTNYRDTLYDWNQLYPRIIVAIREVDSDTPILVGGNGYSAVEWLPYLKIIDDPHIVYMIHQYEPYQYTHQLPGSQDCTYPGMCDTDWDGDKEQFDRTWLENLLSIVDRFTAMHRVPVAVNEFGVMRWVPGAADFMDDEINMFEQQGMNHALWMWYPSWPPYTEEVQAFNFLQGPNPDSHDDVTSSDLIDVIKKYWRYNKIRPSTFAGNNHNTVLTPSSPVETLSPNPSLSKTCLINVSHWLYVKPMEKKKVIQA